MKSFEVIKDTPQERVLERALDQIVDVPVQRILEEIAQITDVPVIQFQEGTVEVIQSIPQERVSERIVEQIVDVPGCPGCLDHSLGNGG